MHLCICAHQVTRHTDRGEEKHMNCLFCIYEAHTKRRSWSQTVERTAQVKASQQVTQTRICTGTKRRCVYEYEIEITSKTHRIFGQESRKTSLTKIASVSERVTQ